MMSSAAARAILLLSLALLLAADASEQQQQEQQDAAAAAWLSQQQPDCRALFADRRPITPTEQQQVAAALQASSTTTTGSYCPALLWTYTGTGNTMTRMLIEAASGWQTGSVYTDLSLVGILPGEYVCDSTVIAVKAHPQWHSFASISPADGLMRPDTPHVPPDAKDVCPCAFDRAVAVIRDPYATFLAEYKRLRTHDYGACSEGLAADQGQACTGGHVSVIRKEEFDATDFRLEVLRMATEWAAMFESYDAFAAAHPSGFFLTTFEDLTSASTRTQALSELLHALGVPPHHQTSAAASHCEAATPDKACAAEAEQQLLGYDSRRLECAFELARHPQIYRPKDPAGVDAAHVYADRGLVCEVWSIVGARAAQHGYAAYGGVEC